MLLRTKVRQSEKDVSVAVLKMSTSNEEVDDYWRLGKPSAAGTY